MSAPTIPESPYTAEANTGTSGSAPQPGDVRPLPASEHKDKFDAEMSASGLFTEGEDDDDDGDGFVPWGSPRRPTRPQTQEVGPARPGQPTKPTQASDVSTVAPFNDANDFCIADRRRDRDPWRRRGKEMLHLDVSRCKAAYETQEMGICTTETLTIDDACLMDFLIDSAMFRVRGVGDHAGYLLLFVACVIKLNLVCRWTR
ncbi:hypothetical protein LXA43DRAFT_274350 [Ganoderma leucocontextum]|nr:hypothetical protein LXA43DRAFT_274350 [Ganoderma leucocontextum]